MTKMREGCSALERGQEGSLPESPGRESLPIPLKNSPPLGWAQGSKQG
jgi:hypothetical protein